MSNKARRRNGRDKQAAATVVDKNENHSNGLGNHYAGGDHKEISNGRHPGLKDKTTHNGKQKAGLVHHAFLPAFLADNEFLLNNHRPQLNSFVACFKSMFSLHTETWNIWTHVGGSMFFLVLGIYYLSRSVYIGQGFTFLIFFLGAVICMGCSGIYHTVLCHSEPVYRLFSKIDYCGVIVLIVTSWAPWVHFGFYCSLGTKVMYAIMMGLLGTVCIIAVLHDKFAGKKYRPLRAVLFVALGLVGVVPGVHYAFVYGVTGQLHMFVWLILMALIYIFGALIYALRIPERLLPGTFDIWFQSHQIMHVCVVVAALFCYHGASMLADHRINGHMDCSGSIPGSEKLVDL